MLERHGRIDILVNNAGIARDQLMLRMKRDDWDQVIATNLTSAFVIVQAAIKPMIKQRSGPHHQHQLGRRADRQRRPGELRGVEGGAHRVQQGAGAGAGSRNITVNVVAPGLIETDMTKGDHREGAG